MGKDDVLLACAHPDDQVLGAGATLAKYTEKGRNIHTIIFSYGELTQPHLKKELVQEQKRKEAREADKVLGGEGVKFLEIPEGRVKEEAEKKKEKIRKTIENHQPAEIFTHIPEDPHPDHRAVSKIITEYAEETDCSVYGFERWSLFKLKRRDYPRLVIDVTSTLKKKIKALKCLESQKMVVWLMILSSYAKAIVNSFKNDMRPSEVFYKLK